MEKQRHPAHAFMRTTVSLLVASSMLTGCTTALLAPYNDQVKEAKTDAMDAMAEAKNRDRLVERVKGTYIPAKIASTHTNVPADLQKPIAVNRVFKNLTDFAQNLREVTGISVVVAPDAAGLMPVPGQTGMGGAGMGAGGMPGATSPGMPLPAPGAAGGTGVAGANFTPNSLGVGNQPWLITYEGSVAGLLDVVGKRFDVTWEASEKQVRIARTATRTFRLVALPGSTSGTNTISSTQNSTSGSSGSGGSSGGGGGGSSGGSGGSGSSGKSVTTSQSASINFENLSAWDAVTSAIKTMIGTTDKLAVNSAVGTVTVTAGPAALERVERYIEETNAAMGKQVVLNVKIYALTLSEGDNYGINWSVVYDNLKGASMTLSSAYGGINQAASTMGVKILSSSNPGSVYNFWTGSNALIAALSTQGQVSETFSTTLSTLNNQPVPVQVGSQMAYVQSSSVTQTANVGSSSSINPGQLNLGLDMNFVPHVQDDGRILLQYGLTLSNLTSMSTFTSNGSTVQLPNVDVRSFIQRVGVRSGETLVLTGFDQNGAKSQSQGVGSANMPLLGGGVDGGKKRTIMVILVQPSLI